MWYLIILTNELTVRFMFPDNMNAKEISRSYYIALFYWFHWKCFHVEFEEEKKNKKINDVCWYDQYVLTMADDCYPMTVDNIFQ